MKLVVGLGNPGPRYAETRHNVGFCVVDRLAKLHAIEINRSCFASEFGRGRVGDLEVGLLKPRNSMNRSGGAVADALRLLPVEDPHRDLVVVLDDVDLPFGRLRIRPVGGDGGHRGLRDVIDCLGSEEFVRLRFGVGRPDPALDTADHVLQRFTSDEREFLDDRVHEATQAIEAILSESATAAMNRFNRDPDASSS